VGADAAAEIAHLHGIDAAAGVFDDGVVAQGGVIGRAGDIEKEIDIVADVAAQRVVVGTAIERVAAAAAVEQVPAGAAVQAVVADVVIELVGGGIAVQREAKVVAADDAAVLDIGGQGIGGDGVEDFSDIDGVGAAVGAGAFLDGVVGALLDVVED